MKVKRGGWWLQIGPAKPAVRRDCRISVKQVYFLPTFEIHTRHFSVGVSCKVYRCLKLGSSRIFSCFIISNIDWMTHGLVVLFFFKQPLTVLKVGHWKVEPRLGSRYVFATYFVVGVVNFLVVENFFHGGLQFSLQAPFSTFLISTSSSLSLLLLLLGCQGLLPLWPAPLNITLLK